MRIAMIGCGNRTSAHIDGWASIPEVEVVACCAPTPHRRDPLAARYGLRAYDDAAAMLAAESPDVVQVVVEPRLRLPLMRLVSEAGVAACTLEKPVAIGAEDAAALVDLERTSRTRFAVCTQFRWHPDMMRCREAVISGRLGTVRLLDLSCGMGVGNQGVHVLDYGLSLIGDRPVERVMAGASAWLGSDAKHPGPDDLVAHLEWGDGVRALWQCGRTAPRIGDPATIWQHVRVGAWCDRGMVEWQEFGATTVVGPQGVDLRPAAGMEAWRAGNLKAQEGFHRAVLAWMQGGEEPGTSLRRALAQWRVVLAAHASAIRGAPVSLRDFHP